MSTRPIDTKKQVVTVRARPVGPQVGASPVSEVGAMKPVQETAVSVDISITSRARVDAQRLDTSHLKSLKDAVADGSYTVDPDALAQRIVEDALGPEAPE